MQKQAFYDGIKRKPDTTFGNVKADVGIEPPMELYDETGSHPVTPDSRDRRSGHRQSQHPNRRSPRPRPPAGRLADREARPLRSRGDSRAAHARQGLGRTRYL